jgi:hypothetical protein
MLPELLGEFSMETVLSRRRMFDKEKWCSVLERWGNVNIMHSPQRRGDAERSAKMDMAKQKSHPFRGDPLLFKVLRFIISV